MVTAPAAADASSCLAGPPVAWSGAIVPLDRSECSGQRASEACGCSLCAFWFDTGRSPGDRSRVDAQGLEDLRGLRGPLVALPEAGLALR